MSLLTVSGRGPFDENEADDLARRFVKRLQTGPIPRTLVRWRQDMKLRRRKTSAPSFVLLGPRGGVVYPVVRLTARPHDDDAIRRTDRSASLGAGTQATDAYLGYKLGFNIVPPEAPAHLPETTIFVHGDIELVRDMEPDPMVELLRALTVHKAQGATYDVALLLGDHHLYSEAGYTALTRGRDRNHAYVLVDDTADLAPAEQLRRRLDRVAATPAAVDVPTLGR